MPERSCMFVFARLFPTYCEPRLGSPGTISWTTTSDCNCSRWHTIWATFFVGSPSPKCQALVDDDLEGEADQDWRKSRDPRTVRHVSDGRGGHFTTAVQDHPSPDFTARPSVTRVDMTISASAKKEIAQDPMGRCVGTRVKSAEVASDGCYWAVNDFKERQNRP